ncbi:MAG: carboxypeptidase regulatory-like domain-containing protein [Candidatus Kerfeldbacteria bacterium]|nr:carboxypeptidase regulatory-like domain-containing protein [Candidatus Kerfeldbacteria bacterium]
MKSISMRQAVPFLGTVVFLLILSFQSGLKVSADSLTFSGTVLTPAGGTYADGGNVNIWNSSGGWGSGIDSSGRFEVIGLQPGAYTFEVGVPASSSYANSPQQQVTLTSSITNFQIKVANPVLKGVLAKPDGTATSGCVNVRNSTWTVNRNSCPGDDGMWKIGALDAGTYILEMNPPQNSAFVGGDQTVTISDPSTTLDLGTIKLENPFIVGKVALPDGTLVPWNEDWNQRLHLSVDLWNSDYTINKHSDYDSNSKFKFGRVPAGTYTLHVNIWDTELYTGSENVSLTVPAGGLDITATPVKLTTPQLSGVVYKSDGLTPIQNAWVNLHNEDWTQSQGSNTDANGKYRIGGLPAGAYKLEVNPPQDMTDVVRPDPVDVTISASLTTKNITLSAAKKFATGTVKKKDGTVVACAQVNANRRGGSGWANARTKSDGTYILTLAPGSWNIRVEPDRGFDCPESDWVYLDPEAIVEFSEDNSSQAEVVNFTVQKATAVITGRVVKKDGTLITNGNVNANSTTQDGRNRWSNAQIKADGTYTLKLIGGTYDLNVWTPDQKLYTKNQKVTVSDNKIVTTNFIMGEKLARITGKVTNQSGVGLPNVQINGNLDCGPEGCSGWSNTRTDANGNYELAVTMGRWFINFDGGQGTSYVYDGPPLDIYVSSETATVTGVDFALTYADVTIKGKIEDENGKTFPDFPGWAYVRPTSTTAGIGYREYGSPVQNGVFTIRVPSRLFSQVELGVHVPQNMQYSPAAGQLVTLVADSTIEKNIVVKKNDAAVFGRLFNAAGLPLSNCNFRAEVFVNTQDGRWYGTQVNAQDCSYELSVLAGTYQLGYNIDQSAGFLNRPPSPDPIVVASGTRVEKNLKVLAGDARVTVLVLNPDGSPARRVWVWADNHEEIDQLRQSAEQQGKDENFRGPGGTTSPEEVFAYCKKTENEKECREFKLPPGSEGPGGCKDALECTRYCQKNPKVCEKELRGDQGKSNEGVTVTTLTRKARIAGLKIVRAQEEKDDQRDFFDNMLSTGGETNDQGTSTLSLVSDHEYTVNAGLPPESKFMPPKMAQVSLQDTKSANITLQLREADGKMTGFVTFNDVAVRNGWMGCWSEDGNSNGSPIINGTYSMNYTFNSTYHCNANASLGTTFLNSDEKIIVIGKQKSVRQNFALGAANFQIPPPVSESFDATQPHVITFADGTTINIPANALGNSGTVTVNANPTINVQSQKTAQPLGYGYQLEAVDANGTVITKFNDSITLTFKYSDEQLAAAGIEESGLVPSYWDSTAGTWKQPPNVTHDVDNNTITVRSDHFSTHAVVGTSGKGRGQTLTSVKVSKSRGVTKITIGSGSKKKVVTPFKNFTGNVLVGTFTAKKSGQVVVAVQGGTSKEPTTLKVYDLKGKVKQTMQPWGRAYRTGASMAKIGNVTNDGYDDLIMAPLGLRNVIVFDPSNKKTHSIDSGATGSVVADAVDLNRTGSPQLVTSSGRHLRVWKFSQRGFSQSSFDERKLSITSQGIERIILRPANVVVAPTKVTAGKKTVTITITGENLGAGSKVLLNSVVPAKKVKASGDNKLTVTLNTTSLKKNKNYPLTVINADGGQNTMTIRTK